MNRTEMMQSSAQSELGRNAENFMEKLESFQQRYPESWETLNKEVYQKCDLNIADLSNLLLVLVETLC